MASIFHPGEDPPVVSLVPANPRSAEEDSVFARIAVLVGCAVILLLRRLDVVVSPQFWAEDGTIFFVQARTLGAAAILEPYAGYYHTVLRLVAWAAAHIDVTLCPAAYVWSAFGMALYVAALTQSARFSLPRSPWYAVAVVMVPEAGEVLFVLTNLQWILAGALLLVALSREPETILQRIHDGIATLLLGLTGPFVVALLPLYARRAWVRRTRFSFLLAGCAVLAAGGQLSGIAGQLAPQAGAHIAWEHLYIAPATKVVGSLFTGGMLRETAPAVVSASVLLIGIGGLVGLALHRGIAREERMWLLFALLAWGAMSLFRCRYVLSLVVLPGFGDRYFFPLQLISLWLLVAGARAHQRAFRSVAAGALLVFVVTNLHRLREAPLPDRNWPSYAARIRRGEEVVVKTNPDTWEFTVPGRRSSPHVPAAARVPEVGAELLASTTGLASEGGALVITAVAKYGNRTSALVWTIDLPADWRLLRVTGPNSPTVFPLAGATGSLEFGYVPVPAQRAEFSLQVSYPPRSSAPRLTATLVVRAEGILSKAPSLAVQFGPAPAREHAAPLALP